MADSYFVLAWQRELDGLTSQLGDLADAMRLAKRGAERGIPGQAEALEMFRGQFRTLAAKAGELRAAISAADAPAAMLVAADRFGDAVIAAGREVGEDVSAVVKGVGSLLGNLPLLLGLAIVLLLVGAAVYGKARGR